MKDILFVSTYYNNFHFIKYQYLSLKKNIKNTYDFMILDDSNINTTSLLTNNLARKDIEEECKKYNIQHNIVPPTVHFKIKYGGLTKNNVDDTNHPANRHQTSLKYFFNNYEKLANNKYKILAIIDSDLFFKQRVDLFDVIQDKDLTGSLYDSIYNGEKIKWFHPAMILFNIKNRESIIKDMDISGLPGLDSGASIYLFIKKYNLSVNSVCLTPNEEFSCDTSSFDKDILCVHYRGGCNWDYKSKEIYFNKFNKLINHFFSDLIKISDKIYKVKFFGYHGEPNLFFDQYKHMMTGNKKYKNLEFVTKNEECDYYIILNKPNDNHNIKYEKNKTLLFHLEPHKTRRDYGDFSPLNYEQNKKDFFYVHDTELHFQAPEWHITYNREFLLNNSFEKNKLFSSITSSNYHAEGHRKRVDFLNFIDKKLEIDIYGKIICEERDGYLIRNLKNYKGDLPGHMQGASNSYKERGLENYKYHFACENNFEKGYVTEKLIDPILCECLTFYDGCKNIEELINEKAFIKVNMNNFEESYNIIKNAIENNEWEKRIEFIKEAKNKILNEINFMEQAYREINKS